MSVLLMTTLQAEESRKISEATGSNIEAADAYYKAGFSEKMVGQDEVTDCTWMLQGEEEDSSESEEEENSREEASKSMLPPWPTGWQSGLFILCVLHAAHRLQKK